MQKRNWIWCLALTTVTSSVTFADEWHKTYARMENRRL